MTTLADVSAYFIDVIAGPAAGGSIKISPQETRVIGRAQATDLWLQDELVSAQHLIVSYSDRLHFQDLRTTNGTILHRIGKPAQRLRGAAHVWNETDLVQIGAHVLQLRAAHISAAQTTSSPTGFDVVQLSPPHAKPNPPPEMEAPPEPPREPAPRRIPWVAMATSALGGVLMAALFRTAFLLIFSILAPSGMLLQFLWEKRRDRREHTQALESHAALMTAHAAEKQARLVLQAHRNRLEAIDPAACGRQIAVPTVDLWHCTMEPTAQWRLLLGLIRDGAALQPFHVSLAAGAVGIFGDPEAVARLTRWLALQVAANFAPSRVQIIGPWDWLDQLPHRAPAPSAFRFLPGESEVETGSKEQQIFFATTRSQLPARCGSVIEVRADFTGVCEILETNSVHELTHLCGLTEQGARNLAQDLAPLRDRDSLPRTSRALREIWDAPDESAIIAHWEKTAHSPGRLGCPIGESATGEPFEIDLSRDGPHALIGGTTGAGKSVLQRALVTSLALTQRPEHLAIVLVDYKGGAAFRCLEQLPHVIDVVTDLDEAATVRTLESLRAELRRREQVLAAHHFSDHEQLAAAGLIALAPRLVIVVDELRALGDQHPDLLTELVQLAALGRSLGVHLVLATQRPGSSVNADMRANINLRIALRVQSSADSHDILELPDAANLPAERPGAALLRLGTAPARSLQVAAITDDDAAALAATIAQAAEQLGARPPRRPWLPPLPRVLSGADIAQVARRDSADNTDLVISAGLRDHPLELRQDLLILNPGAGHLLIAGGPGSGRTTALRTLARHSPVPVHVIARDPDQIVDRAAPWVGTRALLEDQRVIARLCAQLLQQDPHPRLVLIDDADWLLDLEHGSTRSWQGIHELLRRGSARGITVAVAGGRLLLTPRVSELMSQRWILNWPDDTAVTAGALPRGTAVPCGAGGVAELAGGKGTAARLHWTDPPTPGSWPPAGHRINREVLRILPLPNDVTADDLHQKTAEGGSGSDAAPSQIMLGIGGDRAEVMSLPRTSFLIAGPAGSGRTNALRLIAAQCAAQGRSVVVISASMPAPNELSHITFASPDDADTALKSAPADAVVLVDDLDIALSWDPHAPWLEALRGRLRAGNPTIAAATISACASSYSGVLAQLRRTRTGIVLHPGARMANDVFGVDVMREADGETPGAGRGVTVESGVVTALQMARSDQWSWPTLRG